MFGSHEQSPYALPLRAAQALLTIIILGLMSYGMYPSS